MRIVINDKVVTNKRIVSAFVAKQTIVRVYIKNCYIKIKEKASLDFIDCATNSNMFRMFHWAIILNPRNFSCYIDIIIISYSYILVLIHGLFLVKLTSESMEFCE